MSVFSSLPKSPKIPEEQKTQEVTLLLEENMLLREQIQFLRDEIARLKGHKPKPDIPPSKVRNDAKKKRKKAKKKAGTKPKKRKSLTVHKTVICKPEHVPEGSQRKGYRDFLVQSIRIQPFNTLYRQACWQTPDGKIITGTIPEYQQGSHFGSKLKQFILYQYFQCHVTQPLIHEFLKELDIDISTGQINTILSENKGNFHQEKDDILRAGLAHSDFIQVDDTGARHDGQNGYCTQIGNDFFTWFKSTESKSRVNFFQLLQADRTEYALTSQGLEYMARNKLPKGVIVKLSSFVGSCFSDYKSWLSRLTELEITKDRHIRIASEGALLGGLEILGFNQDLLILSDGAGQFNILKHALCWVHAERHINKLVGFTDQHRQAREDALTDIWNIYEKLKIYKDGPTDILRQEIETMFDEIFTRETTFASLNVAMKRIHNDRSEMLLVLDYPFLPLHNNLSENDIREYVKRRKISGSTRSEEGRECRDTFTSLKKTCRKLGISFWKYLSDRITKKHEILSLPDLLATKLKEGALA